MELTPAQLTEQMLRKVADLHELTHLLLEQLVVRRGTDYAGGACLKIAVALNHVSGFLTEVAEQNGERRTETGDRRPVT
jgi:hypothetical protein